MNRRAQRVLAMAVVILVPVAVIAGVILLLRNWQPYGDGRNALEVLSRDIDWVASGTIVTAVAVLVLVAFAVRATTLSERALRAANTQAAASAAAGEAALRVGDAASRAVEAVTRAVDATNRQLEMAARSHHIAERAISESRRQAVLASTPFLWLARPQPVNAAGGLEIAIEAHSSGPAVAINVRLEIEVQDRDGEPYRPLASGPAMAPLLEPGGVMTFAMAAHDLKNMLVTWEAGWAGRPDPPPPPNVLVPVRMRVRLAWLSTGGARARLSCLWETANLAEADARAWRLEEYRIEPGTGEPLVVTTGEPATRG